MWILDQLITMSQNKKLMLKILLLGDEFVGKSCLVYRYINEEYSRNLKATIGADAFRKDLILNDNLVSLQIL
ncbi:uncharacterized protein LOC133837154 [Drosophila sulfurigaster albostrigata]|uniref:uncharacterized protein LOC133837154 n=1 Tax=Drosophila sulfurigaster albostrigata TaxID=89887 RepID=UPI002D21D03D|nr:uncharacterized protein LOC133837154 [Drosophila sulfurigaster albostrigata]